MRPWEIPVPIPNTTGKPWAADGTTPGGVGEQVAAGALSKKKRQDSGARRGRPGAQAWGLQEGEWSEPTRSPSAAGAASCTLKTEY